MHHIAILSKNLKLLQKILSKEKTIESRWYKFKKTPYKNISIGDKIFFKDSGEPITAEAIVNKILFFDNLDKDKIIKILKEYGKQICVPMSYAEELEGKKFCTLIFIKDVKKIKPFNINKKGYGMMAAWITLDDVNKIRI